MAAMINLITRWHSRLTAFPTPSGLSRYERITNHSGLACHHLRRGADRIRSEVLNLNLTLIAHLAVAAALFCSGFGTAWKWQAMNITQIRLDQANERITIQRQARATLERNMSNVASAQAKAADRAVRLSADNSRAATALDRLRNTSANALRSAANDINACSAALTANSQLLGQCGQELVRVAGEADNWASHSVTLQDAWPK